MPIKQQYIKDIGKELLEQYPRAIGPDFEHNKSVVNEATSIESKGVRNRVAGYVTRQARQRE